jgi:hypothetical protein
VLHVSGNIKCKKKSACSVDTTVLCNNYLWNSCDCNLATNQNRAHNDCVSWFGISLPCLEFRRSRIRFSVRRKYNLDVCCGFLSPFREMMG